MRPTDSILGTGKAYGQGKQAPMVNLTHGAQNGLMTNHGTYVNNAPYVTGRLLARLIEAPRGFRDLPNPDVWVGHLKNLIELHPRIITGLNMRTDVDYAEQVFGGSGEMQQTPQNVTRVRSEPEFTYDEKYGMPIWNFYNGWIRNLIGDPESKFPAVVTQGRATDFLPDYRAATVLFFEPDPTFRSVQNGRAWLITNMMPKTDGTNEARFEQAAAGQPVEHTIGFTGIQQVGLAVEQMAQEMLDSMNITGLNPNLKPAFLSRIDADIRSAEGGIKESLDSAARVAIRV
jgi:hypothetical protein